MTDFTFRALPRRNQGRWWCRISSYRTPYINEGCRGFEALTWRKKKSPTMWLVELLLRKVRDSNPRYPKGVYRISSPARSITLPTFRLNENQASLLAIGRVWGRSNEIWTFWLSKNLSKATAKVITIFEIAKYSHSFFFLFGYVKENVYLCSHFKNMYAYNY